MISAASTAAPSTSDQGRLARHARRDTLLLILLVAMVPLFFVGGPQWMSTEFGRAVANLAHIPFFALVTLIAGTRFRLNHPSRWLALTALVILASILVETIQSQVGRSASAHDVLRNLLGSWLTLFWLQRGDPLVWLARTGVAALLAFELFLCASAGLSQLRLSRQLPLVSGLENAYEFRHWTPVQSRISRSEEFARDGRFSLRIELEAADYSGAALEKMPHNWSAYNYLSFQLYNPQATPITVTLRIHDTQHVFGARKWHYDDRFNRSLPVNPGWNEYRIHIDDIRNAPADRRLDMNRVRELRLFATGTDGKDVDGKRVIYADNFRLEE